MLEFNSTDHTYTLDGERIPSVSDLLIPVTILGYNLKRSSLDAFLDNRDAAAERGTKVHQLTQRLDQGKKIRRVYPDLEGYITAYEKFLEEHKPEWTMTEQMVHGTVKGITYAGTLDRYGEVYGYNGPCLVDIKTSSTTHYETWLLQLQAYNALLPAKQKAKNLLILWLHKKGTYQVYDLTKEDDHLSKLLAFHYQFRPEE